MSRSNLRIALSSALAPLLGACSILYNPNNLPGAGPEAGVDAYIPDAEYILDADPAALALESVEPSVLIEGQGAGGSRTAILVIHGTQIIKNETTVAITAHDGSGPIAGITVDNTRLDVAANGRDLAVPVTFAIDPANGKTTPRLRLDIAVTQMTPAGPVTAMLVAKSAAEPDAPALELEYLDELTLASPELVANKLAPGTYSYSQVQIASGGLGAAATDGPVIVRAVSSIAITGPIGLNGSGITPGAGGGAGGAGGPQPLAGTTPGQPGSGPSPGQRSATGGGGGGFATAGGGTGGPVVGTATLASLDAPNRASGGAGGDGSALVLGSAGSPGGGGGGTIELSAGGDLAIDTLSVDGANGTSGGANPGGGGSGGSVLIRAGGVMTTGAITAKGGSAGGTGAGAGGAGRIRFDAPAAGFTLAATPTAYRGPMLATTTELITRSDTPMIDVVGERSRSFSYFFTNSAGNMTQSGTQLVGPSGIQSFRLPADKPLFRGINHFCVVVDGGDASSPSSAMNCFDLVYLYTP